jgi:hypothetical protein
VIEVRRISGTQLDGVSLYIVFCNGMCACKKVYARDEKEAEEKVRAAIENSNISKETGQG